MWDSGLRHPPVDVAMRARDAFTAWTKQHELLPLDQLGVASTRFATATHCVLPVSAVCEPNNNQP
jgi:hypothetical protein